MDKRDEMRSLLVEGSRVLGLELNDGQIRQFTEYLEFVLEWNKKINLTAITEEKEFIIKHFLDSLTGAAFIAGTGRMADIGSGAGLPGLALKIYYPELEVWLVESVKKKCEFLRKTVEVLDLKGVHVICGRAEDVGRDPEFRESFDFAVCRAVSELVVILEYGLPLIKAGGVFLAYKGEKAEEEFSRAVGALNTLGGELEKIHEFILPFSGEGRNLVEIKKIRETPVKYPRRPGVPAKRPLFL